MILNKKEILLITEIYLYKHNHLNEGKLSNFFINLKEKGSKLVDKIKSLKSFFKTPKAFKDFITFLDKNKARIASVSILTIMGMSVIACNSSHNEYTKTYYDNVGFKLNALDNLFKNQDHETIKELRAGRRGIILRNDGSYEIIDFSASSASNDQGEIPNNSSLFVDIKKIKDKSIYGIFFIDIELQKELIESLKSKLKNITYDDSQIKELNLTVKGENYTTYLVKVDDDRRSITQSQAKLIRDKFISNFDSLKETATKKLTELKNDRYKNASSDVVELKWKSWRKDYVESITACLEKHTNRRKEGLSGFACNLSKDAREINRMLKGNLFPSINFDFGDEKELLGTLRHELSHVIDDHALQAKILNEFNRRVRILYFTDTSDKSTTISEEHLNSLLESIIEKSDYKISNANINELIQELLNSGQIKIKRSQNSKKIYTVYRVTYEYMSHYNEIRQHRIDTSLDISSIGDEKEVKQFLSSIKNVFRILIKSEVNLRNFYRSFEDNNRFEPVMQTVTVDYDNTENILESAKILDRIIANSNNPDECKKHIKKFINHVIQLGSGHKDNKDAIINEITTIQAIYDILSTSNNDSETENVTKKVSETMRLSELINDDEKFEDLMNSFFADKDTKTFLNAKNTVDRILKVEELKKSFKEKFKAKNDFDFDYTDILGESNISKYNLVKEYIRLVLS